MTRGAQEFRNRQMKQKEIDTNKEIAEKQLADKQKERDWKTKENRKDRFIKGASILASQFKLPNRLSILNNDPNLYKQFIKELERFTNISTYHRLGAEPWNGLKFTAPGTNNKELRLPGIMVIRYVPTNGPQPDSESSAQYPCNQALNRDKEQILKLNSRSSVNYEGVDIGLNLLCTADIITAITEVRRALVIYQTYEGDNAYLAEQYIKALDIDYDDLDANIADYRKQYTKFVNHFNSSVVAPADATIYARKLFLASNIFADRDGRVKQVYIYRCKHFHILNAAGDGTTISSFETGLKLSGYFTYLKLAIEAITANPDYVEMYADMRHAFTSLLQLNAKIDADETIKFNYDELNRAQIHNLRTLPYINGASSTEFSINTSNWLYYTDSNGYLKQGHSPSTERYVEYSSTLSSDVMQNLANACNFLYGKSSTSRNKHLFDMDKDDITGDDILDITRGNFIASNVGLDGGKVKMTISQCGTEFFTDIRIVTYHADGTVLNTHSASDYIQAGSNNVFLSASEFFAYSKFDWSPLHMYYAIAQGASPTDPIPNWCNVSDLDHVFVIDNLTLSQLNEACTLSLFYISSSGFKQ